MDSNHATTEGGEPRDGDANRGNPHAGLMHCRVATRIESTVTERMQTGAPTFGTPEPAIVLYTVAALARRLPLPTHIAAQGLTAEMLGPQRLSKT